ncbi:MAG: hypothetical protein IPH84_09735 [Bacteroidales bacterium]|nr:hypothetical protein [Bacteroidales bacterium]
MTLHSSCPLRAFLLIAFITLIFSSCKHEGEVQPIVPGINDSICFETEVLPIIQSNCAKSGCHDGSEEFELNSYASIRSKVEPGKANKSELYTAITTLQWTEGFMPPSPSEPLTNAQITTIQLWILEGANNTQCNDSGCDSSNVTFSGIIYPIIELNCKGCHSGASPSAGLSLNTYSQVKDAVENKSLLNHLYNRNGASMMPPSNQLSDCNLAQFNRWINDGTPNN